MFDLFHRNPRLLVLTLLLIFAAGFSSLGILPRTEDPRIIPRFATVYSRYPGASAEQVESLVTEKIEEELRTFEEIKSVESTSQTGIAVIQLELRDEITKVDEVWSRIRDKLSDVTPLLPAQASPPEFEDDELATAYTFIAGLVWQLEGPANQAVLKRFGEALEDRFLALSGTEHTHFYGDADEEIHVGVSVEQLSALGMTVAEVSSAIRNSDSKVPAGVLRSSESDLLIEVEGEPTSLDAVRRIPIRYGHDGKVVRVQDIATVEKGAREPMSDLALVNGKPAVVVAARMAPGRRVDQWSQAARDMIHEFEADLPGGITVERIFDQSGYVKTRFDGLIKNLLLGTLAVLIVSFLMMGWKSALLVGAALPLTSLMVLAGMRFLGVPLHQMSVTGLIIALGMMIDNAIIMVDEVRARLNKGNSAGRAIYGSVRYLAIPLLGSTLTTVLAFMPLVLMPGPAGEFVGSIAVTVILALLSSLFLALTITPTLVGWVSRKGEKSGAQSWWRSGISIPQLNRFYRWSLERSQAFPLLGILIALLLPALGFWKGSELKEQFFPPAERDQFQVQMELPRQTSLEETRTVVLEARELMRSHPAVKDVQWFAGTSAPAFYYNMLTGQDNAPYFAQAMVQLHQSEGSTEVIREIQNQLDESFPFAQSIALQLEQGPPFPAPIELRVYGPDLDRLHAFGDELRAELAQVPNVTHTRLSLRHGQPKLLFKVNEEDARLAGLENVDLARRLNDALEGVAGGSMLEETEELPIRVRLAGIHRDAVQAISSIDLALQNSQGEWVPLASVGEFDLVPEWSSITRRNGLRLATVQGFIHAGILPAEALRGFQKRLDAMGLELPRGYFMEFGGEAAERDEAVGNLMAAVGILVVLMAATLVLSFRSFRLAGMIAIVAFLSMGLGLAALWVFDFPFGFMAIVGTMGLIGVAINDSIVVLAAFREDPAARAGEKKAIVNVVMHSTRHVLTTTVTTMAGFMPLILAGGMFWPPLAVAIAFGVLGATMLALFFVPSAYALLVRLRQAEVQTVALPIPAVN